MKRGLIGLLAGLVLVSGCATVPTKGAIRNSTLDGLASDSGGVGVEARPPRAGATPEAIVNGFLEAMSDSRRGFDRARQYMTPQAAAKWKPEDRTIIYVQDADTVQAVGKNYKLSAKRIATIDDRGEWQAAGPKDNADFVFDLVKVDGQWRVDSVPDGVLLGSNQVDSKLVARDLYFFSRDRKTLVPDRVYLPQNNLSLGQAATQLIQELLKGPSKRFGNGVTSVAPPGTAIQVSVPVELGEATVALNDAPGQLVDDDRHRLAAQIVWTLNQLSLKVKITVNGAPLLPDSPGVIQFSSVSEFSPVATSAASTVLYGLLNGKVQKVDGLDGAAEITAKELNDSKLYGYDAESFAVNLRGDTGAVVTEEDGKQVVVYGKLTDEPKSDGPKPIEVQGRVLRPSFDNLDNLWFLDRADGSKPRLRVRTGTGIIEPVPVDFHGDVPQALRVAPDGVRVLMVLKSAKTGQNTVQIGTLRPADNGKGLQLDQMYNLQVPLTQITDAAWSSKGVLVVGKPAGSTTAQPWLVNSDGSAAQPIPGGAPPDGSVESIASNLHPDTLPVFEDTDGHLHWQGRELSWVNPTEGKLADGLIPVYPG